MCERERNNFYVLIIKPVQEMSVTVIFYYSLLCRSANLLNVNYYIVKKLIFC